MSHRMAKGIIAITTGAVLGSGAMAVGEIDPGSGIDLVTIRAPGNAPWVAPPGSPQGGTGVVDYEYRIGRYEVTSAQWVEFFNAAYDRPVEDRLPYLRVPQFWGGIGTTPNTPGGQRWTTNAQSAMLPVGDISWRMAAMYCNWLHNNKSTDRAAFLSGAYDVSTFGEAVPGVARTWTDQAERSPGARYFIPTRNEWMKAAHFDPNKLNADGTTGGWWLYSNSSDERYVWGPPGATVNGLATTTNSGWIQGEFGTANPYTILLGAYDVTSPWGLYDVAGGSAEWLEDIISFQGGADRYRRFDGSYRTMPASISTVLIDQPGSGGGEYPSIPTSEFGFRVAAVVPSSGALCGLAVSIVAMMPRRRRIT
jgi:formylglycine-generating enzyme required for sulfatase activity